MMSLTPAVRLILFGNVAIYVLQMMFGDVMTQVLGLRPSAVWEEGLIYQVVTYMFLHGGFWHIGFNMLALWMFGGALETVWGTRRFVQYYFLTGIGAGVCNVLLTPHSGVPIIGASGAIYGLLAAYAIMFPNNLIYLWGLVPIKAKWLVLIYAGIEFFSSFNPMSPVAHLVHLGGMVIGVIYLTYERMQRWFRNKWSVARFNHYRKVADTRFTKQQEERRQLQLEIDTLLDRINKVGYGRLSRAEKQRLDDASKELKDLDKQ